MAVCEATGRDLSEVVLGDVEDRFNQCVQAMLSEKEFLLPLATAARQYWSLYHQMTAAALYEDLWSEALQEFVPQAGWGSFSATERGAVGNAGDYIFNGLPISHKTSSGVAVLAVLWDSLVAQSSPDHWSSEIPILFMGLGFGRKTRQWVDGDTQVRVRAPWYSGSLETINPSSHLALVGWKSDGSAEIFETFDSLPAFDEVWLLIDSYSGSSFSINEFELLIVPNSLLPGKTGRIGCAQRPGSYLFPKNLLQNVPMGSNNRALLIERPTVISLCNSSRLLGTATPFPVWPQIYADFESSGLFKAQRQMCSDNFPILNLAEPEA